MKSIVGLVEYTVTGGFLWILFLLFAALIEIGAPGQSRDTTIAQIWQGWMQTLPSAGDKGGGLSPLVKESVSVVITGILFIGIFTTGLLLDLVAPVVFAVWETRWTRKWLLENQGNWLRDLINEHRELIADDYGRLTAERTLWRPRSWQVEAYWRLILFVISYVLTSSKGGQQEEIFDRMKVWRVSRAISVSLFILSLLLSGWILIGASKGDGVYVWLVGVIAPWAIFGLSWYMASATFSRLIAALRAAAYLGWVESRRNASAPGAH